MIRAHNQCSVPCTPLSGGVKRHLSSAEDEGGPQPKFVAEGVEKRGPTSGEDNLEEQCERRRSLKLNKLD